MMKFVKDISEFDTLRNTNNFKKDYGRKLQTKRKGRNGKPATGEGGNAKVDIPEVMVEMRLMPW